MRLIREHRSLTIVIVLGLMYRCFFVNDSFIVAEATSFFQFAYRPFAVIFTTYHNAANHFLHTILMRVCYLLFGSGETSLRLPALIPGVLCILLTYKFARLTINDEKVGVLSAYLVATSSAFVHFSNYSRGYALQTALVLGLSILSFRPHFWENDLKSFMIIFVLGFLILFTIPTGIVFVVPILIFLFIGKYSGKGPGKRVVLLAGAAICFASIAFYFPLLDDIKRWEWIANYKSYSSPMFQFPMSIIKLSSGGILPPIICLLLMIVGMVFLRSDRRLLRFFSLVCFTWLLFAFSLYKWFPFMRFWNYSYTCLYPFMYILVAVGIVKGLESIGGHKRLYRVSLGCLVGLLFQYNILACMTNLIDPSEIRGDWHLLKDQCRKSARNIMGHLKEDDRIWGVGSCHDVTIMEIVRHVGPPSEFKKWASVMFDRNKVKRVYFITGSQENNEVFKFLNSFGIGPGQVTKPKIISHNGYVNVYLAYLR